MARSPYQPVYKPVPVGLYGCRGRSRNGSPEFLGRYCAALCMVQAFQGRCTGRYSGPLPRLHSIHRMKMHKNGISQTNLGGGLYIRPDPRGTSRHKQSNRQTRGILWCHPGVCPGFPKTLLCTLRLLLEPRAGHVDGTGVRVRSIGRPPYSGIDPTCARQGTTVR